MNEIARMSHQKRINMLMRGANDPAIVATADRVLREIGHEYLDVIAVREMHARRLTAAPGSTQTSASLEKIDDTAPPRRLADELRTRRASEQKTPER